MIPKGIKTARFFFWLNWLVVFSVRAVLVCNDVLGRFTCDSQTSPPGMGTIKPAENILDLVQFQGLLTV